MRGQFPKQISINRKKYVAKHRKLSSSDPEESIVVGAFTIQEKLLETPLERTDSPSAVDLVLTWQIGSTKLKTNMINFQKLRSRP